MESESSTLERAEVLSLVLLGPCGGEGGEQVEVSLRDGDVVATKPGLPVNHVRRGGEAPELGRRKRPEARRGLGVSAGTLAGHEGGGDCWWGEGGVLVGGGGGGGCGAEGGRGGSRARGGDDGRLGLAEEPLDGLAVRLVPELSGELEDAGGADDGHADAAAVHLAVPVLGGRLADGENAACVGRRDELPLLLVVSSVGGAGRHGRAGLRK
jgi:hypothetical protein